MRPCPRVAPRGGRRSGGRTERRLRRTPRNGAGSCAFLVTRAGDDVGTLSRARARENRPRSRGRQPRRSARPVTFAAGRHTSSTGPPPYQTRTQPRCQHGHGASPAPTPTLRPRASSRPAVSMCSSVSKTRREQTAPRTPRRSAHSERFNRALQKPSSTATRIGSAPARRGSSSAGSTAALSSVTPLAPPCPRPGVPGILPPQLPVERPRWWVKRWP